MAHNGTWLCQSDFDRERLRDMAVRLKPVRFRAMAILGGALVISGPWVGYWTLVPLVLATLAFALLDRRLTTRKRPEYWVAAAWALSQLLIAVSIALTGGSHSPAVAWLAVPVVTLGARFNRRGLWAGLVYTVALMLAATLFDGSSAFIDSPQLLLAPLALIAAVATLSTALMRSDLDHRTGAVVDPLTGLLNRSALALRFEEVAHQARITHESVGVIVGDLDNFKSINDAHGHSRGDAVLKDTAYAMRKSLRSFDLIYRLGGEEFLILLPGATTDSAHVVAERVRRAVEDAHPAGVDVSISLGVSAAVGTDITFERLFERADLALYEAKHRGRNRVHAARLAA
jgi:diguanylate cyclase (GGDEF)-like protein